MSTRINRLIFWMVNDEPTREACETDNRMDPIVQYGDLLEEIGLDPSPLLRLRRCGALSPGRYAFGIYGCIMDLTPYGKDIRLGFASRLYRPRVLRLCGTDLGSTTVRHHLPAATGIGCELCENALRDRFGVDTFEAACRAAAADSPWRVPKLLIATEDLEPELYLHLGPLRWCYMVDADMRPEVNAMCNQLLQLRHKEVSGAESALWIMEAAIEGADPRRQT